LGPAPFPFVPPFPTRRSPALVAFTLDRVLAALALGWVVAAVWQGRTETPVEGTLLLLNGVIGVLFLVRRPAVRRAGLRDAALCLDRKSTRLNSSHVKISYAVF